MGLILFHSCQKERSDKSNSEIQNISNDDAMIRQIISFKETCESYLANPGLKSGGSISVDSAVFYIAATMNFTYGFDVNVSDMRLDTSFIIMPVNSDGTIEMEDVASLLEEVTDSVRAHYQDTPYQNKKLIAISLDYYLDHNEYKLIVISAPGNTFTTPLYNDKDWRWGEFLGSCDGTIPNTDAAEILENIIYELYYEKPPANTQYYWPNPQIISHVIDPNDPNSYSTYININDPDGSNNHLDYIIFYNDDDVIPYTDTLCLFKDDEMPFYKNQYMDLVDNALNINPAYKFKSCDFNGHHYYYVYLSLNVIRHEIIILVGIRWTSITNSNYPISIE